jgi:PTH1 family peptidyl-tRNA hydrolase
VIHDDIDITFGILKIKEKGGHGGHKGLKSLIEVFHEGNFKRFRIGIGRPEPGASVSEYVLGRFNIDEKIILDQIITRAQDAVVTVLCKGIKDGMNRFNNKRTII